MLFCIKLYVCVILCPWLLSEIEIIFFFRSLVVSRRLRARYIKESLLNLYLTFFINGHRDWIVSLVVTGALLTV